MGQPMLPGMSGGQNEASGDRATEQVTEVRRLTIQSRYILLYSQGIQFIPEDMSGLNGLSW